MPRQAPAVASRAEYEDLQRLHWVKGSLVDASDAALAGARVFVSGYDFTDLRDSWLDGLATSLKATRSEAWSPYRGLEHVDELVRAYRADGQGAGWGVVYADGTFLIEAPVWVTDGSGWVDPRDPGANVIVRWANGRVAAKYVAGAISGDTLDLGRIVVQRRFDGPRRTVSFAEEYDLVEIEYRLPPPLSEELVPAERVVVARIRQAPRSIRPKLPPGVYQVCTVGPSGKETWAFLVGEETTEIRLTRAPLVSVTLTASADIAPTTVLFVSSADPDVAWLKQAEVGDGPLRMALPQGRVTAYAAHGLRETFNVIPQAKLQLDPLRGSLIVDVISATTVGANPETRVVAETPVVVPAWLSWVHQPVGVASLLDAEAYGYKPRSTLTGAFEEKRTTIMYPTLPPGTYTVWVGYAFARKGFARLRVRWPIHVSVAKGATTRETITTVPAQPNVRVMWPDGTSDEEAQAFLDRWPEPYLTTHIGPYRLPGGFVRRDLWLPERLREAPFIEVRHPDGRVERKRLVARPWAPKATRPD